MTKSAKMTEADRQNTVAVFDDQHRERLLHPREGEWYTIVTAAPIYHGRLIAITPCDYILQEASWIPDTGRLSEYVRNPSKNAKEAEYVGDIVVPRGGVMALYSVPSGKVDTR